MTLKVYLMSNSLGSYYVSLGMKADYDAFSKCKHAVEGIANSVSRLVGTVRNASVIVATGLGTIATASGGVASQTLLAADTLGISAKALKEWQIAAKIARVDVNGFIGAMGKLDTAMVQIGANSQMDNNIIMAFGKIKQELRNTHKEFEDISEEQFIKADPEQRVKDIFNLATQIDDQKKAALWVSEILGEQGKSFYQYLKHTGKSINDVLAEGAARVFETEESMEKAMKYNESMIKFSETTKSLINVLGDEVGGVLTPFLNELDGWLVAHGDTVTAKIQKLAKGIDTVTTALKPIVGNTLKSAIPLFKDLSSAMTSLIQGNWDKLGQDLESFFKHFANGTAKIAGVDTALGMQNAVENAGNVILDKDTSLLSKLAAFLGLTAQEFVYMGNTAAGNNPDLNSAREFAKRVKGYAPQWRPFYGTAQPLNQYPPELQAEIIEQLNTNPMAREELLNYVSDIWTYSPNTKQKGQKSIQDGIIRPNGQVTQVAPDDWVFALRDVGNFSNALASQNTPAIPMRSWDALLEDINKRAMDIIPAMTVHNNTNAPQHITIQINQTVTSPSNDWLPQTLREQAALGVQDGLQQARKESFNRLQMMSGTL